MPKTDKNSSSSSEEALNQCLAQMKSMQQAFEQNLQTYLANELATIREQLATAAITPPPFTTTH